MGRGGRWKASVSEVLESDAVGGAKSTVFDFYILGQAGEGVDEVQMRVVQESLWSLQYRIPGVVASFLGSIPTCRQRSGQRFSFSICLRFSNHAQLQSFRQNEGFKEQWESFLQICGTHLTFVTQQKVPNELEVIFRKGAMFDEGCDHLMVLRLMEPQSAEAAIQFLSALSDITQNPEIGAVSTSLGTVSESSSDELSGDLLVLASHISRPQGVAQLESIPPVQQLWEENGNGLLKAELAFSVERETEEK